MDKQYKVVITKIGSPIARLTGAKALKALKSISLSEALDLINNVPCTVHEGPKAEAEWLDSKLCQAGIDITIEELLAEPEPRSIEKEIGQKAFGEAKEATGHAIKATEKEEINIFCRNCGKKLLKEADFCVSCGVKLPKGDKFCNACGAITRPELEICVVCGVQLSRIGEEGEKNQPDSALRVFKELGLDLKQALEGLGLDLKQAIGIIGSIILFFGVFAPFISAPLVGSMNYFQSGRSDGTIVLILAVASFILTIKKEYKGLWYTGLGSLGMLAYTFIAFQVRISQMRRELADDPFAWIGEIAIQSVQLQWGWALLIVGTALLITAAFVSRKESFSINEIADIKKKKNKEGGSKEIDEKEEKAEVESVNCKDCKVSVPINKHHIRESFWSGTYWVRCPKCNERLKRIDDDEFDRINERDKDDE